MIRAAAVALLACVAAPSAMATESADYGAAFVDAFATACVPERLSYAGTRANAEALGWITAERDAHPELMAMMSVMDSAAASAAEEMEGAFEHGLYTKPVADLPHYLVVSRASFNIGEPDDPLNPWVYVGCYLYNFDATAPIDPAPVSALTGNAVAQQVDNEGLVSYVWGPPCPMPRTGDSYLTFIADNSPHAAQTGFSGLMLKFETSELDPGAAIPEPYC